MMRRLAVALFAILSATLAPFSAQNSDSLEAAVGEDDVEFDQDLYAPGDTPAFHIRDGALDQPGTCAATWTDLAAPVLQGEWWNLAVGTPAAANFSLSPGCAYDAATPSNTPLTLPPTGQLPWVALVDGVNYLVGNFNPITGEISLLNTADPGSQVQVSFYFRVANSYTANDHRVRVHSASDPDGEWVAISEVTSESDATASPTSDLFKGEVPLSGNNAASGSGDGAVWVQSGGMLTVTYYEADVVTVIASHQASIVSVPAPSPTPNASPTPIPSVGPVALGVLAGALALFLWQRTRGRPTSA